MLMTATIVLAASVVACIACILIIITLYVINLILPKKVRSESIVFNSQKTWRWIYSNNINLSKFVLFLAVIVLSILWAIFGKNLDLSVIGEGVFIETFGMVFDVILLVLLYNYMDNMSKRDEQITRYNEEIDDFREWKSEEAKYRIRGNVVRLNRLKYSKFNLAFIDLRNLKLEKSKFNGSNLVETDFSGSNLADAEFIGITSSGAKFNESGLDKTVLVRAKFNGSHLQHNEFKKAKLMNSDFSGCNLSNVNFSDADLRHAKFNKTYLYNPIFDNAEIDENFFDRLRASEIAGHHAYDMYYTQRIEVLRYPGHYQFFARRHENANEYLSEKIGKPNNLSAYGSEDPIF